MKHTHIHEHYADADAQLPTEIAGLVSAAESELVNLADGDTGCDGLVASGVRSAGVRR